MHYFYFGLSRHTIHNKYMYYDFDREILGIPTQNHIVGIKPL